MKKVLFKEEQRFRQWWIWMILVIVLATSVFPMWFGLYSQLTTGKPWGNQPASDLTLTVITLLTTILVGGIFLLVGLIRLQTEISEDGISFRYPPLLRKWRTVTREDIASYEAGKYNPIWEYGGWGIRQGFRKDKKAFNVSGNIGLKLVLKNGKTILIGTHRLQAISVAMEKMMKATFTLQS